MWWGGRREEEEKGDSTLHFQARSGGSLLIGSALLHLPRLSRLGAQGEVRLLRDAWFAQRQAAAAASAPGVCSCVPVCCVVFFFFSLLLLLLLLPLLLLFLLPPRPWMLGRHFPALQPLRFWCFFLLSSTRECTSADLRNSSSRVSLLGEILKETALKSSSWIPTGRRGGVAGVGMA